MDAVTARRARVLLLLALPAIVALGGTAQAADGSSSPPSPIISVPAPSTSSVPTTPTSAAPRTSAGTTHRATKTPPHRYRSTTRYQAPSTRSASSAYSISESATGGPTQTFVLGSASLGTVSSSMPVVTASPTSGASSGDSTDRYVHVFFAVIVGAALLLAAGITGLVLTRDGRYGGGTHR